MTFGQWRILRTTYNGRHQSLPIVCLVLLSIATAGSIGIGCHAPPNPPSTLTFVAPQAYSLKLLSHDFSDCAFGSCLFRAVTRRPSLRHGILSLEAAKGGGGQSKGSKSMAVKAGQVRADELLVRRGLADNLNHAMALILKGAVIADEGKIKVSSSGQPLAEGVVLRLKGTKAPGIPLDRMSPPPHGISPIPASGTGGGFQVGKEEVGIVVAHHGSRVIVERVEGSGLGDDERVSCGLTPLLKEKGILTGDRVRFCEALEGDMVASNNTAGRKGVVLERLDRKTLLTRPAKSFAEIDLSEVQLRGPEQMLAAGGGSKLICANVDQMLIVISPRPLAPPLLVDSHIVAAIDSGIEPVIVLNKCDLLDDPSVQQMMVETGNALPKFDVYEKLGYPVVRVSTVSGYGLSDLQAVLRGKTSIMVGQSGVGKSSLLNRLMPHAQARVGDLSEWSGLGSHTTTHAELHHIPSGGDLIDCAGFRDFGTWHLSHEAIQRGFKEIEEASLQCKYRNCRHGKEPGCAVKSGVDAGDIAESRLRAFHDLAPLSAVV